MRHDMKSDWFSELINRRTDNCTFRKRERMTPPGLFSHLFTAFLFPPHYWRLEFLWRGRSAQICAYVRETGFKIQKDFFFSEKWDKDVLLMGNRMLNRIWKGANDPEKKPLFQMQATGFLICRFRDRVSIWLICIRGLFFGILFVQTFTPSFCKYARAFKTHVMSPIPSSSLPNIFMNMSYVVTRMSYQIVLSVRHFLVSFHSK